MGDKKEKVVWIELLRTISIFSVILIHTSSAGVNNAEILNTGNWMGYNFYASVTRFGVCCFTMISGYLMLSPQKETNIRRIYSHNIKRMVTSFIAWSFFYAAFSLFKGIMKGEGKPIGDFISEFILGEYHMWFILMLIGLYMAVPLLKKITDDKKLTEYFLVLCAIFCLLPGSLNVIPSAKELMTSILLTKGKFYFVQGFAFYFVSGYYFGTYEIKPAYEKIIYILGVIGAAYSFGGGTSSRRLPGRRIRLCMSI